MAVSPEQIQTDSAEAVERSSVRGPVVLFDRYQIAPQTPLADFNTPSAQAFAAEDRRDASRKLFALICTPGLPPRSRPMTVLRGGAFPGVLPLADFGIVDWPHLGQRCMAILYERPAGGTLEQIMRPIDIAAVQAGAPTGDRISEHDVPRRVISPISRTLQRLAARELAHRAIRPDNIFFMDGGHQELMLGDCATTPPGFDQPVVFETIDRGMASPAGRGEGDISEDLYALGVTLAICLLGRDPVAAFNEDEILAAKIEHGTYHLLCGNERIPLQLVEPLRGLLGDTVNERWDLEQLASWLAGIRASPIQRNPTPRSLVPMPFAGRDHITARTLARAFTQNVAEAASVIYDPEFDLWLRRGLGSSECADAVAAAVVNAQDHADDSLGQDDYLVTRVSIALDPQAPISYKGVSFLPEAFGPTMAVEFLRRGDFQIASDIIALAIPSLWYAAQGEVRTGRTPMERTYANLQEMMANPVMGYGMERCLYALNLSLPCQSPLVIQEYVAGLEDILPALNHAAKRVDANSKPMDRHIAAFISAHFDRDIDPQLEALSGSDDKRAAIGLLSLLARLQAEVEQKEAIFGLSSWVGSLLGPAIRSYHSRTTRRELEREIPRLVRQGSLLELYDLIENPERRAEDVRGYAEAEEHYVASAEEISEILEDDETRTAKAEETGQQSAAMTSIIITFIFVGLYFLIVIY
jgi:hypothetical protein